MHRAYTFIEQAAGFFRRGTIIGVIIIRRGSRSRGIIALRNGGFALRNGGWPWQRQLSLRGCLRRKSAAAVIRREDHRSHHHQTRKPQLRRWPLRLRCFLRSPSVEAVYDVHAQFSHPMLLRRMIFGAYLATAGRFCARESGSMGSIESVIVATSLLKCSLPKSCFPRQ